MSGSVRMYDKTRCRSCKWRGWLGDNLACLYSFKTFDTCIARNGDKVEDIRGDDPGNCKLYEKGKPAPSAISLR